MSYSDILQNTINDLNDNCRNNHKTEFCRWNESDIQPGNHREYCVFYFYGGDGFVTSHDADLCESCEKILGKSDIKILSLRVHILEEEVRILKSKCLEKSKEQ